MKELYKQIGARVREIRNKLELDQDEFALIIHEKSPSKISKIESGAARPSAENLISIAIAGTVSLHWLLTGKEFTPPLPATPIVIEIPTEHNAGLLDIALRLREEISKKFYDDQAFCRQAGILEEELGHLLACRFRRIPLDLVEKIARTLNVSIDWVVGNDSLKKMKAAIP